MLKTTGAAALAVSALAVGAAQAESTSWWESSQLGLMGTYLTPSEVREAESEQPGAVLYWGLPLNAYEGWSTQISAAWNEIERDDETGQDQLYQLGVDILRHFNMNSSLSPYVITGLAVAYEEIGDDDRTRPSISLGGGVDWQTPFQPVSLRLEARAVALENEYDNFDSGRAVLVDGRFGLGAMWAFGKAAAPVADGDGDGVIDGEDLCPDTAPGAKVDRTGCDALSERDSDADGVSDALDQCPGTPPGEVVDAQGCPLDDAVLLKGVNFQLNSDELTASARDVLSPVADLLNGGLSEIRVEIAGHTDALGNDDYNQALSARRAYAVKDFLAERGVSAERMVATGYGSSRPVADNATEEGREKNRRVVFRVLN